MMMPKEWLRNTQVEEYGNHDTRMLKNCEL